MNFDHFDEEELNGCLNGLMKVGVIIILLVSAICLAGCKSVEYVPVPEIHTEHHWHTDSMLKRDSTHTERETIIRELDSAAMAQYGIQMQNNQKAWLVLQREMEERLRELEHKSAVRDTVRDSIPKPYPVEVVKTKTNYSGWFAFFALLIVGAGGWIVWRKIEK